MSMQLGGSGGIKSDINVTPLVDVMLVLLIIMMIIAPMLQKGVDVKLPTAANTVDKPEVQDQTVVAVNAAGQLFLDQVEVPEADLARLTEPGVRELVVRGLKTLGFRWIALDLEGLRSGSLNPPRE